MSILYPLQIESTRFVTAWPDKHKWNFTSSRKSAFRLQVQSIAGEQVFGRNDVEYWYAPPIGPVLKSDSRYWIASMLHQHSGGLPYLEPATVIQRLQDAIRFGVIA